MLYVFTVHPAGIKCIIKIHKGILIFILEQPGTHSDKPVVDAVLVVDMEQLVFYPGNLLRGLPPPLCLQRVLPVDRCQAHHGLLTHTPLMEEDRARKRKTITNHENYASVCSPPKAQ